VAGVSGENEQKRVCGSQAEKRFEDGFSNLNGGPAAGPQGRVNHFSLSVAERARRREVKSRRRRRRRRDSARYSRSHRAAAAVSTRVSGRPRSGEKEIRKGIERRRRSPPSPPWLPPPPPLEP